MTLQSPGWNSCLSSSTQPWPAPLWKVHLATSSVQVGWNWCILYIAGTLKLYATFPDAKGDLVHLFATASSMIKRWFLTSLEWERAVKNHHCWLILSSDSGRNVHRRGRVQGLPSSLFDSPRRYSDRQPDEPWLKLTINIVGHSSSSKGQIFSKILTAATLAEMEQFLITLLINVTLHYILAFHFSIHLKVMK